MSEKPTYEELEKRIKESGDKTSSRNREDEARIQKLYMEQLFEGAPEAIAMGDRSHNILRINSEFTRLFGYTAEEAIGVSIDDLIAPPELLDEAVSTSMAVTEEMKEITFETRRRHKDGTMIHVSVLASPIIIDNERVGTYGIYRNITERKLAEAALQKAHEELERRVEERTTDLAKANRALQAEIAERKQAEEKKERQAVQAQMIYKVGQKVSSKLEPEALLSEIVTTVYDTFNYYGVMLMLLDDEEDHLALTSIAGGYADVFPEDLRLRVGEGMIGHAAKTKKTQISGDVTKNPYYVSKANEITLSELSVPIISGNKVFGVLDIQSDKLNDFDKSDVTAMVTLSTQIAIAVENAKLYEQAHNEIAERERLINELRDALKKIRTLSGLLPICAACKKIRDDKGYWNQIESYIGEHSEAEFSHSICPECAKELYPDIDVYD